MGTMEYLIPHGLESGIKQSDKVKVNENSVFLQDNKPGVGHAIPELVDLNIQ